MNLAKKVKDARNKAKLTQLQLAERLDMKRTTLAAYEAGNNTPPADFLKNVADACGIPITFFFSDEATQNNLIARQELKSNPLRYTEYLPEGLINKNIVYLDKIEMLAGAGAEGVYSLELFNSTSKIGVDRSFLNGLNPANLKLFEVIGDSMFPEYDEGDLAIVDMVNHRYNFIKISGIYIIRIGDIVHIKRVEFLPGNTLKLISLNPKYGVMYPHKDGYECEIIGKVCGKIHYEISKGLTFDNQGIG